MIIDCPNCKKSFYVKDSRAKKAKVISCSMNCRTELYKNFPELNPSTKIRNEEEKFFDEKSTRFKMTSKKRNLYVDKNINGKFLYDLWISQNKKCYYSNIDMTLDFNNLEERLYSVSIDRVDSSIGYVKENLVLCCYAINSFKFNFKAKDIYKFLNAIKDNYEYKDKKTI